jgi:hypothetical protein
VHRNTVKRWSYHIKKKKGILFFSVAYGRFLNVMKSTIPTMAIAIIIATAAPMMYMSVGG